MPASIAQCSIIVFILTCSLGQYIDSQRMGNHTRFINHENGHRANTYAKISLVNLEHRIKFHASKSIRAGEELFFDYGQQFTDHHNLQTEVPTRNKKPKTPTGEKAARKTMRTREETAEVMDDDDDVVYLGGMSDGNEKETRRTRAGRRTKVMRYTR